MTTLRDGDQPLHPSTPREGAEHDVDECPDERPDRVSQAADDGDDEDVDDRPHPRRPRMVLVFDGRRYHGAAALTVLEGSSAGTGPFGRFVRWFVGSPARVRLAYPWLRRLRRAALLAKGKPGLMLFSDNVSLGSERALKERAHSRGLLVMGPDCGTAYIAGTPLAFANVVPPGRVGVIAASGTGLQEVAVLLARAGGGISHGIGVGGRDLSDAVGGLSTLDAIDLLASDAGTDHLILVSKPPGRLTACLVFERIAAAGKPCTAVVFGASGIETPPAGPVLVPTLKDAVERATGIAPEYDAGAVARREAARLEPGRHALRGLFCGGTLTAEAYSVLEAAGLDVASNTSSPARFGANAPHTVIDLGADEYTVGRPHPMIDPALRTAKLREALAEPAVAVVLLDVVLGLGAHPDPARPVCDAVLDASGEGPAVVASVCGTRDDPQDCERQAAMLVSAGVVVAPSNADAAAVAAAIIGRER